MIIFTYLLIINLVSFILMGLDKKRAREDMFRISEKTLLLFAFFGGSLGALCGMYAFSHKTKKQKFTVTIPVFLIMHTVIVFVYLVKVNM